MNRHFKYVLNLLLSCVRLNGERNPNLDRRKESRFFGGMCQICAILNNYSARPLILRSKAGQGNRRRELTSRRPRAWFVAWYLNREWRFSVRGS